MKSGKDTAMIILGKGKKHSDDDDMEDMEYEDEEMEDYSDEQYEMAVSFPLFIIDPPYLVKEVFLRNKEK